MAETNATDAMFYDGRFGPIQVEVKGEHNPSKQETVDKRLFLNLLDEAF